MNEDLAGTWIDRCKRAIAVVALAGSFMASAPFAEGDKAGGEHEADVLSAVVRHQENEPHNHPETGLVTTVETGAVIVTGVPLPNRAYPGD